MGPDIFIQIPGGRKTVTVSCKYCQIIANKQIACLALMQRDLNITRSNVQSILEVMCAECFNHKAKHSVLTTPDLINE